MNKDDSRFAYEIRQALIEQANDLPATTTERLLNARRMALARQNIRPEQSFITRSVMHQHLALSQFVKHSRRLSGIAAIVPIMAGMILLVGLYHAEQNKRIVDLAELDAAVLTDELPPSAYVDNGFKVFVTKGRE